MDPESLRQAVTAIGPAALSAAFTSGVLFSFNPVALAAIPVTLAYVSHARSRAQATGYAGMFVLGMIVTHIALGLAASVAGQGVQQLIGRRWGLLLGPLLIALGLLWSGALPVKLPRIGMRIKPITSAWGAFALGAPFTVAICPFCTPALVVLLGVAAAAGSPLFGGVLLLAFALGRTVPLMLGALAIGWLEHLKPLRRLQRPFEIAGGILLMLTGLYLLNAYFYLIPSLAG